MTKILLLAAIVLSGATAHAAPAPSSAGLAAIGDDSTCKIGCWANSGPSASADVQIASALKSLGLAQVSDRLA